MSEKVNLREKFFAETYHGWEEFIESTKYPERFHEENWKRVYGEIKNGPFWRSRVKFPKDGILPLSEFEITEFSDYEPWLKPESDNRLSPLTRRPIIWWGQTTGTTTVNRKLIPFTQEAFLNRLERTGAIQAHINLLHLSDFQSFKMFFMGGLGPNYFPSTNIPYGMVTAFTRTFALETSLQAVPRTVYRDLPTFKKWAPVYALTSEIVIMGAVTASPILEFIMDLQDNFEEHLELLVGGGEEKEGFPKIDRKPERIEFLRQYFKPNRKAKLKEIWPSLQMILTWKTGSSAALLERLEPYLSPDIKVVHNASHPTEAGMTFASLDSTLGGPLDIISGIVEFVEVGLPVKASNLIPAWKLEVNKNYEVFFTNSIGLVRYRIHDIFKCIGHYGLLPILQFVQKEGAAIAFGVAHLWEADLLEAMRNINLKPKGKWIFAPGKGFQNLEIIHDGSNPDMESIVAAVEDSLIAIHPTYKQVRSRGILAPLTHRLIGSEHKFWKGFPDHAQAKLPTIFKSPFPEEK